MEDRTLTDGIPTDWLLSGTVMVVTDGEEGEKHLLLTDAITLGYEPGEYRVDHQEAVAA